MRAVQTLPGDYEEVLHIDLQKDKKTALKVNIGGSLVMVLVLVIGHFIVPAGRLFGINDFGTFLVRMGVLFAAYLVYIVLHELTHAAVMKAVGGGKVRFGFTGIYAFAGSLEDYFDKTSYRAIALAPLILWGVVFGVLAAVVPEDWFWVVWFLQAGNIGGAAGDVYVTAKLWRKPETILVRDTGVDMTVYDRTV